MTTMKKPAFDNNTHSYSQGRVDHNPRQLILILESMMIRLILISTIFLPAGLVFSQDSQPESKKSQVIPQENSIVIVEGQMLNHLGGGLKGVKVTVRYASENDEPGSIITTTTTDQYGDFSISVGEEVHEDVVVVFSKPMYADFIKDIHVGHDDSPVFISEMMEGNLIVSGNVIDSRTNKPMAKVIVKLDSYGQDWEVKTNGYGWFIIKGVTPGSGELIVENEGFGREVKKIPALQNTEKITIELKPERIVTIQTIDELKNPLQGVTVECIDRPRDDFRTLITDEKGNAKFTGIHFDASTLYLRITHDDFVSSQQFDQPINVPEKNIESKHRITLIRAGKITGRILDWVTSQPIQGARASTGQENNDDSPRDWSDDTGVYTITGVTPGRVTLTVHISGYAPELKIFEVTSGETTKIDVKLRQAMTLSGLVVDQDNKPIPGAYIETTLWRGRSTLDLRTITDTQGQFSLENTPPDEFEISVRAAEFSRIKRMVKAGNAEPITLHLKRISPQGRGTSADVAHINDPAPSFDLTSMDGKSLKLGELKGKTILLDFWATWCPPCVEEFAYLKKVHEKYGSRKDFIMIGISRDFDEPTLKNFLRRDKKIAWHQVFGEKGGVSAAVENYGVSWIPQIFIIGPDGKIRAKDIPGVQVMASVEMVLSGKYSK